jgi:hypothetical protein
MGVGAREYREADALTIIFGDSFLRQREARAVAADYPEILFVFGSPAAAPRSPTSPCSTIRIHEEQAPTRVYFGIGRPDQAATSSAWSQWLPRAEVNRITNADLRARAGQRGREVKVTFINSWPDPAPPEAALA